MASIKRLPSPIIESYAWQWEGACMGADSSVFFSPEAERGLKRARREENAKAVCARCPVIEQCREHALAVQEPYGVWGGLSEDERAQIVQARKARSTIA